MTKQATLIHFNIKISVAIKLNPTQAWPRGSLTECGVRLPSYILSHGLTTIPMLGNLYHINLKTRTVKEIHASTVNSILSPYDLYPLSSNHINNMLLVARCQPILPSNQVAVR